MADGPNPIELPVGLAEIVSGCEWTCEDAGESGAGVWRLARPERTLYLKHGASTVAADIADEAHRLAWLRGRIAVPQVVHFTQENDAAWLVTTALPGRSAYRQLACDPGGAVAMVAAVTGYLRDLHALSAAACPFSADHALRMTLASQRMKDGLVDTEDFDDEHLGWSPERLWAKLNALAPHAPARVVTHGDFSLDNIMIQNVRVTGCIDWGRMGVADPYQDLAILWNGLAEFGTHAQATLWRAYAITSPDQDRLDFHLALDEFF